MRKVLLIDDEEQIAALVSLCLQPLGVEVVHALDLEAALLLAKEGEIGLVLLDLALDHEDGLELLPALRSEEHLAGVPVLAFSAHDSRKLEALERGADSFIGRPFATLDLRKKVELYLVP
jgi:DNA-binding response OmpR family regulator